MKSKRILRNVLLLLVAGSLLYMAAAEISARRNAKSVAPRIDSESAPVTESTKLIVYYFSEGKECYTCEQIPTFTREALDKHFAAQLTNGSIVWRTVDVDEPRNEHFISEFNIYTKSIVFVRLQNGQQVRWKNLDRVWDLVYDRAAFVEYVNLEVREQLEVAE
jgi:hypothetical protein